MTTRLLTLLGLMTVLCGCGPILIGLGLAEAFSDDPQDLGQPEVGLEILDQNNQAQAAPAFTNAPLRFQFKGSKPGIALTALLIGPVITGTTDVELERIEADFCNDGLLPGAGATVASAFFSGLSTDSGQNAAFNSAMAALADGAYRLFLRGTDAEGRVDCVRHFWLLDTLAPPLPRLARLEALTSRSLRVTWTIAIDLPATAGIEPSGVSGYNIYYEVGGSAIPDVRAVPPTFLGNSFAPPLLGGAGASPVFVPGAAVGSFTMNGLFAGRVHYVRITAVDRAGNETDLLAATELSRRTRVGGDGTFLPPVTVAAGTQPVTPQIADFDNDGCKDVVVANRGTPNATVLYGDGGSGVAATANVAIPANALELRAAQISDNNLIDLAVLTETRTFLFGGTGTRAAPFFPGPPDIYPTGLTFALGDFGDRGVLDMVIARAGAPAGDAAVFSGFLNPRGYRGLFFEAEGGLFVETMGAQARCLLLVDLDGDHRTEMIYCDEGSVGVKRAFEFARWEAPQTTSSGGTPEDIVHGDFNEDGRPDLAVSNRNGDVAILIHQGATVFQPPVLIPVGTQAGKLAVKDFDRDGILDLAIAGAIPGSVTLLFGNGAAGKGDGTFRTGGSVALSGNPTGLATADWNKDGLCDLVVTIAEGSVDILLGNGAAGAPNATFQLAHTEPVAAVGLTVGDFNEDGVPDLAAARGFNGVDILIASAEEGQGDATIRSRSNIRPVEIAIGGFTFATNVRGTTAVDHDGDGILDLLGHGRIPSELPGSGNLPLFLGNGSSGRGNGSFRNAIRFIGFTPDPGPMPFNCDAPLEDADVFAVAGRFGSGSSFDVDVAFLGAFLEDHRRGIQGPDIFLECNADGLIALDADQDHALDLVALNGTFGSLSVLRGNRFDNTFAVVLDANGLVPGTPDPPFNQSPITPQTFDAGVRPAWPVSADFNCDGAPDLALINRGTNDVSVLPGAVYTPDTQGPGEFLGGGAGRFPVRSVHTFPGEPTRLAVGDFNGDRIPDLAVLIGADRRVSFLLSNAATKTYAVDAGFVVAGPAAPLEGIVVADFNSDGIDDIAVGGDAVRIFTGNGVIQGQ